MVWQRYFTNASSPFTITAFENAVLVGSTTSAGHFLPGFDFPEGEIAFEGQAFNQAVLSSPAQDFAVDNINVVATPEPGTLALLGLGLTIAGIPAFRRRKAGRQ